MANPGEVEVSQGCARLTTLKRAVEGVRGADMVKFIRFNLVHFGFKLADLLWLHILQRFTSFQEQFEHVKIVKAESDVDNARL